MIVIHYNQLQLAGGVGDFKAVAIDTIVEVPDTYANREVIREIANRAHARSKECSADLLTWKETFTKLCQGPSLCFCICTPVKVHEKKQFDLMNMIDDFLGADFKDKDPRKGAAAPFIEAPHFVIGEDSTRRNFIINYQPDYDRLD